MTAAGDVPESQDNQDETTVMFQSDRAMAVLADAYPWLLEQCTDDEDEIDTRALQETLAGMVGLFIADYQEAYGEDKAREAMEELVNLALLTYEDRVLDNEDDD